MATGTASPNYQGVLVASTVDTITTNVPRRAITVISDGTARIDYTLDGSTPAVTGTATGRTLYASTAGEVVDGPIQTSERAVTVVKLISTGTPHYSIEPQL